jgi:hypothetical protein
LFTSRRVAPHNRTNRTSPRRMAGIVAIDSPRHWAIDRGFDWPERGLLHSLKITMVVGDLSHVGNIRARVNELEWDDKKMRLFLDEFDELEDV